MALAALGAEVFASGTEKKIVYHTCKSRFCPSCGARAANLWAEAYRSHHSADSISRNQFHDATSLLAYFPAKSTPLKRFAGNRSKCNRVLGESKVRCAVILMVVQQTYGGFLNFYPHLHTLVSAGGLEEFRVRWVRDLKFQRRNTNTS